MKKNAGMQNLTNLDFNKIGEKASFSEKEKKVIKTDGKKKGFIIYPHEALIELMKEGKEKGKLSTAIGPYFIAAAQEKLLRDGFERELREKGLL